MINSLFDFYGRNCGNMPRNIRSFVSKMSFTLMNKPRVSHSMQHSHHCWQGSYNGALVISADFELAWAWRFSKKKENPLTVAMTSRMNMPTLIRLFKDYEIPVTWATVGHLLLNSCKKSTHKWMHRIDYFENNNWLFDRGDWYDGDPYSNVRKENAWYASDIVEKILDSRVGHEIGCHTFSHIDFSYQNCPPQVAEDEIQACIQAAKKWDITLKSFVFPAGTYGNYEILKKYDFTCYRKCLQYDLSNPLIDQYGMTILPSSSILDNNGMGWTKEYFVQRLTKYIQRAMYTKTLCHFWFHPCMDPWFLREVLPSILKYAAEQREENNLWITTMGDLADHAHGRY